MKQNNILNTIATTAIALILAVLVAQAAGAVTVANVDFPGHIAVDGDGNIYVADTGNNTIQKFSSTGAPLLTVGSGQIEYPSSVAVDGAGNIYVADDTNRSVKKFSPGGTLLKTISGEFNFPTEVAVDSNGNIYVADSNFILTDNHVLVFDPEGVLQQSIGNGQLNFPIGIALDSAGNIYVADSGGAHNHIMVFNSTGFLQDTIGAGMLKFPDDVDVDSAGNIYVADTGNDRVMVFNPDGSPKYTIGTFGSGEVQFNLPMGVAVDEAGTKIYVADGDNNRVQVLGVPTGIADITGFISGNGIRGSTIESRVNVTNTGASDQTYVIVVSGVDDNGYPLAGTGTLMLAAGQSINNVPVKVSIPAVQPVGSYSLLAGVYPIATYPDGLIMARGPVTAAVS